MSHIARGDWDEAKSNRLWTSIQAVFHPKRLGLVEPPTKVDKEEWIFVYGGSSEYQ